MGLLPNHYSTLGEDMTILKGFSPSNTVTSYSGSTIGSGYYSNPITPREFDNVPMHDAVFSEDMQPELLDPKPEPKRIKRWWDEDVLRNEEENTLKDYNAKFRAEWLVKKWKEAEIKNKNLYMKNVSDYSYIA